MNTLTLFQKIKLTRGELLNANNQLRKKTEETEETAVEYKKQNLLAQEINNSKRELSEIKDEIKKYSEELKSVKIKANSSPDVKKMKEEKEKLENEMMQKERNLNLDLENCNFIKDQMVQSSKSERTEKIVDAASAVVASMNQKLQTTLTELDAVKKALENEREQRKNST